MQGELKPTGECWCGCGAAAKSFFKGGHDRRAESLLIMGKYGGVAQFLDANGYGPGKKNLSEEMGG